MYKLYWNPGTMAMAPHIVLEECGAPYDLIRVDTAKGDQHAPWFQELNPARRIPVLEHGPLRIAESAAISLYLAQKHESSTLLPPVNLPEHAKVLQWLLFSASSLHSAARMSFYPELYSDDPAHAQSIRSAAEARYAECWDLIEQSALEGPFVLGNWYTVADAHLVTLSTWTTDPRAFRARRPKVQRLFEAAAERIATQKVLRAHGEL